MTRLRPPHRPLAIATLSLALAATLSACSDDATTPVATSSATSAATASATRTTSTPTDTPTTSSPVSATATSTTSPPTAPEGTATPLGRDAAALAELLPLGFPIPPELEIVGDPTSTADNANVTFTVPSGPEVFAFYRSELPAAGFEFQPGTSDVYSTEVASGAIIARSEEFDLNLLVVDNDVELTLTRIP